MLIKLRRIFLVFAIKNPLYTVRSDTAQQGVYVIRLKDNKDKNHKYTGSVTLVK